MSVIIDGVGFDDKPSSCGTCGFFSNGSTYHCTGSQTGHCRLFNEMHKSYRYPPRRCVKLFNKAFREYDGEELVITMD